PAPAPLPGAAALSTPLAGAGDAAQGAALVFDTDEMLDAQLDSMLQQIDAAYGRASVGGPTGAASMHPFTSPIGGVGAGGAPHLPHLQRALQAHAWQQAAQLAQLQGLHLQAGYVQRQQALEALQHSNSAEAAALYYSWSAEARANTHLF
ncbi:hypothetical protein MNEG_3091, partial [Monoraphidium neglectum]